MEVLPFFHSFQERGPGSDQATHIFHFRSLILDRDTAIFHFHRSCFILFILGLKSLLQYLIGWQSQRVTPWQNKSPDTLILYLALEFF